MVDIKEIIYDTDRKVVYRTAIGSIIISDVRVPRRDDKDGIILCAEGWICACVACGKLHITVSAIQPHCDECSEKSWELRLQENETGIRTCTRCMEKPSATKDNPYPNGQWSEQCHDCHEKRPLPQELIFNPPTPYSCGGNRCGQCAKCHVDSVVSNMAHVSHLPSSFTLGYKLCIL